ncbi:pentapeptide repeat-containing protein [Actinomadura sp. NPDC049753]|uniref:pentapeptide repeat-containing protein n=1 Tax=Actinomadura sp. NPDC049753 TaxID=3154739 RepID=UPI003428A450
MVACLLVAAHLVGAVFTGADLTGTDLTGARLHCISGSIDPSYVFRHFAQCTWDSATRWPDAEMAEAVRRVSDQIGQGTFRVHDEPPVPPAREEPLSRPRTPSQGGDPFFDFDPLIGGDLPYPLSPPPRVESRGGSWGSGRCSWSVGMLKSRR